MTVLIAEDEIIVRKYLVMVLKAAGVQCVGETDTADGAEQLAAELQPDFLLLDIRLRGERDGLYAARQISQASTTPILLMSAYDPPRPGDEPANVIGFLSKPITPAMLTEAMGLVREAISVRRPRE